MEGGIGRERPHDAMQAGALIIHSQDAFSKQLMAVDTAPMGGLGGGIRLWGDARDSPMRANSKFPRRGSW